MTDPVTVLCVLYRPKNWSGGCLDYTPTWVERLHRGVAKHSTVPVDFACLTDHAPEDMPEGVRHVPYADERNAGTWLGITEVMRPGIGNRRRVVLGLDSVIVGNIDWLLRWRGRFGLPAAPYGAHVGKLPNDHVSNALCAWDEEAGFPLWERLRDDREAVERETVAPWSKGQPSEMLYWRQDAPFDVVDEKHPGKLLSFNHHYKADPSTLRKASIVYFHGHSKPHRSYVPDEILRHWV